MSSMAQPGTPEQWVQRSQLIPHAASGVVVQFPEDDPNDFLRDASITQDVGSHVLRTLNLPSTFNTISPYVDVQFGGGLPMDPPMLLPLAIPHRLDSLSSGVWTYGSEPVNRYETPGWGDSNPRGPYICCPVGGGPRYLEILL